MEDLTLPIHYVFLKIICHRLRYAEVLHRIRYSNTGLFTNSEEVINGTSAGKNDRSMIQDIDPLLTEIVSLHTFNMNERAEIDLQSVFLGQIEVW